MVKVALYFAEKQAINFFANNPHLNHLSAEVDEDGNTELEIIGGDTKEIVPHVPPNKYDPSMYG
jgi:hypothetical protein